MQIAAAATHTPPRLPHVRRQRTDGDDPARDVKIARDEAAAIAREPGPVFLSRAALRAGGARDVAGIVKEQVARAEAAECTLAFRAIIERRHADRALAIRGQESRATALVLSVGPDMISRQLRGGGLMLDQVFSGLFSGAKGLLLVYVGYAIFLFGKLLGGDRSGDRDGEPVLPKWKAGLVVPVLAAVLGLIATADYHEHEGGDYLFDPGQVVDVEENTHRVRSFVEVFLFSSVVMWVGVKKAEPTERDACDSPSS